MLKRECDFFKKIYGLVRSRVWLVFSVLAIIGVHLLCHGMSFSYNS